MRTEQLRYFREAIHTGSISAAANDLYISPQTLTAALKSLEKEIGHTLFTTSRHGISATPQGQIVVDAAEKILACIDAMNDALNATSSAYAVPETVVVQVASVVAEYLFPEIFQTIINQYPHIAISIENHDPLQIIENIKNAQGDLGILGIQYALLDELGLTSVLSNELTFMPLFQYKLSVAISKQHPLAQYRSLSLKTLIKYPIVFQTTSQLQNDLLYHWLSLYGNPIVRSVTPSAKLYLECIKSGAAAGFFPSLKHKRFHVHPDKDITLIPLNDKNAVHTVGYLYNNVRPVSPATQLIMKELETLSK